MKHASAAYLLQVYYSRCMLVWCFHHNAISTYLECVQGAAVA